MTEPTDELTERLKAAELVCVLVGITAAGGHSDEDKARGQAYSQWNRSYGRYARRLDDDEILQLAARRDITDNHAMAWMRRQGQASQQESQRLDLLEAIYDEKERRTANPAARTDGDAMTAVQMIETHQSAALGAYIELGGIIERLEREDPTRILPIGFANPHSYRGYYEQLAFEPVRDISIGDMLTACRAALGATFEGWKGGEYRMAEGSECWISHHGESADNKIGPLLLDLMLAAGR